MFFLAFSAGGGDPDGPGPGGVGEPACGGKGGGREEEEEEEEEEESGYLQSWHLFPCPHRCHHLRSRPWVA